MATLTSNLRKSLLSAGVITVLGFGATSAMAQFADFTVDPTALGGATVFNADKITGNYVEVITFNPGGSFDVSLRWNAGQFVADDGINALFGGGPNGTGLNNTYGMYALYQGSGTFVTDGGSGITTFTTTVGAGSFALYIDPNLNTTFGQPANGTIAWSTGLSGDDFLIATGIPQAGAGTLNPNSPTCGNGQINCGSFGTSVSFELTPAGEAFFVAPVPFYNLSFQSGQLNNFQVAGTQTINGSMDVVFDVPEPGTLALLGLAFAGLGFTARRRSA